MLRALLALLAAVAPPPVAARVHTGLHPCGAVAAFGALWVANDGSGTLARVDPHTNRVTRRVRLSRGVCSVAAGAGSIWVTNYRTSSVVRVDPHTGATRSKRVGRSPFDVVATRNSIWVSAWEGEELIELAPKRLRILRRFPLGARPAGMLVRGTSLWVGFGRTSEELARVDLTKRTVRRVKIGVRAPGWFADGARDLWVTADDDALVHVDPETGRVVGVLRLGRTLAQPTLGGRGLLWVPDKEIDRVFRVDAASGRVVDSFPAGDGAFAAVRAFGSTWVTSYAGDDVWRFADPG